MASIFLMPQAVPLPSQSKIAGLPGQAGTGQPVQTSPFDFSSEQWSTIQQLLQCMAEINSPQGNEIFAQVRNKVAQKSRIGSLAAAFNQFATVAAPFSSAVMPNMLMMANYVSNYGNQVVPSAYSALASLLDALQTQAPTPGDRRHFDAILLQCTEEANNYAQQAASIVDPINSFTEHAANFKSASDSTPQTQLVQIIPDVGGAVAMGVSDDHSKVMGRNTDVHDPLQLWNLEYAGKNWTALLQIDFLIVLKCPFPEATPIPPFRPPDSGRIVSHGKSRVSRATGRASRPQNFSIGGDSGNALNYVAPLFNES